jgi:ankyrin repeat protein
MAHIGRLGCAAVQTYTTPLLQACLNNHIVLANVLIKRGAQWAVKNTQGLTPLDMAMQLSKGSMIKLLNVSVSVCHVHHDVRS